MKILIIAIMYSPHRHHLARKNSVGFTLIELLVVIAIIGLLASIILISLRQSRLKSRDAKRLSDLKEISTQMFEMDADNPHQGLPGCDGSPGADLITTCSGSAAALNKFSDPSGGATACKGTASGNPSTAPCQYTIGTTWGGVSTNAAETDDYEVCSYLESGAGPINSAGLVSISSDAVGNITAGCY